MLACSACSVVWVFQPPEARPVNMLTASAQLASALALADQALPFYILDVPSARL